MGFRFMYGLRTVSPFVIGMSGFSRKLFLPLNAASAALWATIIGGAGYIFGRVLRQILNDARQFERPIVLGIFGCGIVTWIWSSLRSHPKP
jgi:membrane protein DedA with SNARE-associated domain